MTDLIAELAEVVRLSGHATPGPWECFNGHMVRHCDEDYCAPIAEMRGPYRPNVGIVRGEHEQQANLQLIVSLHNFIRAHAAEIEAMARDAERMKWLRQNWTTMSTTLRGGRVIEFQTGLTPWATATEADINAAIDAAMRSAREGGE